jgi:hypothetical protein
VIGTETFESLSADLDARILQIEDGEPIETPES